MNKEMDIRMGKYRARAGGIAWMCIMLAMGAALYYIPTIIAVAIRMGWWLLG